MFSSLLWGVRVYLDFVGPKAYTIWGPSLRKRRQDESYKMPVALPDGGSQVWVPAA